MTESAPAGGRDVTLVSRSILSAAEEESGGHSTGQSVDSTGLSSQPTQWERSNAATVRDSSGSDYSQGTDLIVRAGITIICLLIFKLCYRSRSWPSSVVKLSLCFRDLRPLEDGGDGGRGLH